MGPGTDSLKPELPKNHIYSSSPGAATTSCTQDVQLFLCLEMSGMLQWNTEIPDALSSNEENEWENKGGGKDQNRSGRLEVGKEAVKDFDTI